MPARTGDVRAGAGGQGSLQHPEHIMTVTDRRHLLAVEFAADRFCSPLLPGPGLSKVLHGTVVGLGLCFELHLCRTAERGGRGRHRACR